MCIISITGATGNMGSEVLKALLNEKKYELRILLRKSKKNIKFSRKLCSRNKNVKVFFGSLTEYSSLLTFVKGIDYCIHMAAHIPPYSDYHEKETIETNYLGTKNLITAIIETGGTNSCKFVHIGSVAQYGNRTSLHPFGRVGDPLLPSVFDVYAASKVKAERVVIESPLSSWVSLRQTGVLYDDILFKNMNDGLMFHTPLNCPIEWVTARDSAILIKNLVEATESKKLEKNDFYRKVYNIGGGKKMRVSGFETLNEGFRLMGCSVKDVFSPEWIAKRNFHCMWFSDSHVLEELFHFQKTSFNEFFAKLKHKFWYFSLAKPFLALVKLFTIKPLLKNKNAPMYWKENDYERWKVFSNPDDNPLNENWENVKLLCENIDEKTNSQINYEDLKNKDEYKKLDHGYDESKHDSELDIEDIKQAAHFRGGEVLSPSMQKGDLYTKIDWKCHEGHVFSASPYLILKAGHWCPECASPPWSFGKQAKHMPFYAQLYYDDHKEHEDSSYEARPL
ncbi:MAG: NAD-dependent epimerase/dehydratase family protein [Treponema sp.]